MPDDETSIGTARPPADNPAIHLLDAIETEILPRLMLVHTNDRSEKDAREYKSLKDRREAQDEFLDLMIDHSVTSGHEFVDNLVREGISIESIYVDLLAPTARRMGELWEEDIRNFAEVTIGLCRLHEVLRHNSLSPAVRQVFPAPETPSILLSTACGDQHVFGVIMVAEFFIKEGWRVTCEPGAKVDELLRIVSSTTFDVVGLSVARSHEANDISGVIGQLRTTSRNKDIKVIIGGALVGRDESIAGQVGADAASTDASTAPTTALDLLAEARVGC
ncbi:MAG: cobalamin-dependent protein [Henriciella sp.]|uniref:cobalamin B12-binding domain-containing protein n=1 Tax=Henriciella sp. TaxID=1968823 RepID=UPI003C73CD0A